MAELMRYFVAFAPIGLLAAVALLLMGQIYRLAELREHFAWLEAEGHARGDYDFAAGHLARARLCRSAFAALCVAAAAMAFAGIAAAVVMRSPRLGHLPTFVLVVLGLVAVGYAMAMMIMDARVELAMFRARHARLARGDAAPGARRGGAEDDRRSEPT